MNSPQFNWHFWDRIKLRTLSLSQISLLEERSLRERHTYLYIAPEYSHQWPIHRLALLIWIDEVELAKKFWEEDNYLRGSSFEDFLFRIVICEKMFGWGYKHPEFEHLVRYAVLTREDAFKLSTIPLSDLQKMDEPHFSSLDGLIDVNFNMRELERVAEIIPEDHHRELRLPLILLIPNKYETSYTLIGSKLEVFLLQELLRHPIAPFKKFIVEENMKTVKSISKLKQRRFKTIYTIFPEFEKSDGIWLSTSYKHPFPLGSQK